MHPKAGRQELPRVLVAGFQIRFTVFFVFPE